MILVYFITTLISFFWLIRMIQEKKIIFNKTPLDTPFILFFISQLISTIFSIHPRTSWLGYYSRFNGGLLSIITYLVLYYAFVSNIYRKELKNIFITIFFSSILVSIYGILEHFGHSFSCLLAPGVKQFSVNCWKQDVQTRVFASFGQPNWLAAYAILLLPVGMILTMQKKYSKNIKIFFGVSSIMLFVVLLFTKSRSGILGLITGLVTLGIGLGWLAKKKKQKLLLNKQTILTLVITFIFIILTFGTPFTPSISKILHQTTNINSNSQKDVNNITPPPQGGTKSGDIRKIVWKGGLNVWKRYPLIGSGVETFAYSYYLDRPKEHNDVSEWDFLYNKAHNELINLLANSGIFGLLTYLNIYIFLSILTYKTIVTNKKQSTSSLNSEDKTITLALFSGIVALFISNFFGFSTVTVNTISAIFFANIVVIKLNNTNLKLQKKDTGVIKSGNQYLISLTLAILTLVMLNKIYNYWNADRLFAQGKAYFNAGQHQTGIEKQQKAISLSPNEALYYDSLSNNYAKLAIQLAKQKQATATAQVVEESIKLSNTALEKNSRNLNFYKTRARVFITLAQLNEDFLNEAQNTLDQAIKLAPTDPKLIYTQAVIELSNNNINKAKQLLEKAVKLKPNYEKARNKLEQLKQP